ncbi:hypothetical protein [Mycolicibacterium pulveris]|uniref:hypothetical protein n=1 Tax=Mycolicibacterium pulveris TaxID=36813 RepID=UPI003CF233A0
MEEPDVVAQRLTETAKDVVDQARVIAKGAIADAADIDNFTAAKMIDSYMKMVDLALTGGLQVTKDVLGVETPGAPQDQDAAEGRRLVADAMESISRRMLRQTSVVAKETADLLDKNPNSPTIWAQAMVKMADIALLGGTELAETALIGPAPFEKKALDSDTYHVGGSGSRTLRIRAPGLVRPGTADPIPTGQLKFFVRVDDKTVKEGDVLEDGVDEFYISAQPAGMISGMYVGVVEVLDATGAVIQTVDVEVPL